MVFIDIYEKYSHIGVFYRGFYGGHHLFMEFVFGLDDAGGIREYGLVIFFGNDRFYPVAGCLHFW